MAWTCLRNTSLSFVIELLRFGFHFSFQGLILCPNFGRFVLGVFECESILLLLVDMTFDLGTCDLDLCFQTFDLYCSRVNGR